MRHSKLILVSLLLCVSSLLRAADETGYYLVGWLNDWSTTDQSYPLTLQADGVTWEITVPAAGDDGWFKIAPASAYEYDESGFWSHLYCAPYDGCRELSGAMAFGDAGAWLLPNEEGVESYTIRIVPSTNQFQIVPRESQKAWSGTLPVLFLNTEQDITSKEYYVDGTYYIDALGLEGYESLGSADHPLPLKVKGRGNWTWKDFSKKPYRLKFDAKARPLGMKSSKHFTLLAHADDDLAFLRNTVGFELSRRLGLPYTPAQQPVEVVLNGDYIGLYMLTDKIRVAKDRVNITEQADQETNAANITGGWLLEIDNYEEDEQIRFTESNGNPLWVTYHSPEVLSDAQREYLTNFLIATDLAIYNPDKNSTDWEQYIDMDMLARYYIVQEIMDDGESFHGSCYMSKDRGADTKLMFGPVWDFGNALRRGSDKFIYQDTQFTQSWIEEVARYGRFQQTVKAVWQKFLADDFAQLDGFIDSFIAQIASAAVTDGQRWPEYDQGDVEGKKNHFKYLMTEKVNFLREQWGNADTSIRSVTDRTVAAGAWFSLDGRRLSTHPTLPGVYLHQGRKVVIK